LEKEKMKKTITAILLSTVLMIGTTFADGIIVAGRSDSNVKTDDPCVQTETTKEGIIVAGFTGIIVAGFTGIIVAGFSDTTDGEEGPVNCGIIVAG
jgi:hypothetical protein